MRPDEIKTTIKAGVFIISLLSVIVIITATLNKENPIFSSRITIHSKMKNSGNLKGGAQVQLKGIKIGIVSAIEIHSIDEVKISMTVDENAARWIKEDSILTIETLGMLGDKYVQIIGGSNESSSIADGGQVKSHAGKELKDFVNQGEDILVTTSRVMNKVDMLLEAFLLDDRISTMLTNMNKSTDRLARLLSEENIDNFSTMTKNFSALSKQINQGPGTVHSLLYDTSVHEDLKSLLGGAHRSNILKYFIRETIRDAEKLD